MKKNFFIIIALLLLAGCATAPNKNAVVRVAVLEDMMKTGLWPALAARFEAETGYRVEVTASGNRDRVAEAFCAGKADLVTIQACDVAGRLIQQGYALNSRAWTRNEYVIVGPRSDPAGIRGLADGAIALQRVSARSAAFVHFQNSGNRDVTSRLWTKAAIPPGNWLLEDESENAEEALASAQKAQAYVVLARSPNDSALFAAHGMEILVQGDPQMRGDFVVMEANPKRVPAAKSNGARALSDFLLNETTQQLLLTFGTQSPPGHAQFYPVNKH